jgi:hypothetical protein
MLSDAALQTVKLTGAEAAGLYTDDIPFRGFEEDPEE